MKRCLLKLISVLFVSLVIFTACNKNTESDTSTKDKVSSEQTCTLIVNCITALGKAGEKDSLLPTNGIIYSEGEIKFNDGESVFDVLKSEMQSKKIHLEFSMTPIYNTAYIEGIANLYEFDCGELSGWMFKVNGEFPGVGCSSVSVHDGDVIEFVYSCDMGKDVGKEVLRDS